MLNKKRELSLLLMGATACLPALATAETVFEEVAVTYDGGGVDSARSGAVDLYGNLYVTGVSDNSTYFLAKYDSYGREKWVQSHATGDASWFGKGNAMVVDRNSNAYMVLSESYHFGRVLKYDAQGNETILAPGGTVSYNWDHGIDLVLDKAEENLILRQSNLVKKINLGGGAGWEHQLNGNWNTWVRDIAVDTAGNVYAVGVAQNTTGNNTSDVIIDKFDADGNVLWSKLWYLEGQQNEDAYGLELDSAGNVYVLTQALNLEQSCYYCATSSVVKLDSAGDVVSSTVLNGTDGYLAGAIKVADDQVTVTIRNKTTNVLTAQRLNADLSLVWSTEYSGGYSAPTVVRGGIDVDGLGNVIAAFSGQYGVRGIVKFDMNGNESWTLGSAGTPTFVKFGITGEIYSAGTVSGPSNNDGFMNRYGVTQLTCQ